MKRYYAILASATLFALTVFFAMGCVSATTKVASDWDRDADFSEYHSYAFSAKDADSNNVSKAILSLEVGERLEEHGLVPDAKNPDLLVYVQGSASGQIQFASGHMGYQPSAGWSDFFGWGFGGYGGYFDITRNVAVGTVIVDLVEADEKILVWRSLAEKSINTDNAAKIMGRLSAVTKDMFKDFPRK
ncbi:MAG: hypothetical protein DRH08_03900 [Deltaproteobacteria bacterium]|nr:MAG: hypothetical protein DRH08_03900 [Deltaproteobacteria bacterium]